MQFDRMIMEKEAPEEMGYDKIKYNLSESSIADRTLADLGLDLNDLLLFYGDHSGIPELRNIIGKKYYGLGQDNVLVCAGACMALFIVNATILSPEDQLLVVQPNYATNIEVPKSLSIGIDLVALSLENEFKLDVEALEACIQPETKLISVTYPHNPSGVVISESDLMELIEVAERHGCYLLVDETYRELTFGKKLPTAASLSSKAISVESVSKSFGIPGIRIGWVATQDPVLMERFLATKEQIVICNSVVDEQIAFEVLKQKEQLLAQTAGKNIENFEVVKKWMAGQDILEWVEPSGGVVCFPRFKSNVDIDTDLFYQLLLEKYDTFVGPGRWFNETDRHFRIGYGWPTKEELTAGLDGILSAARDSRR
ncbi:MAG: pyridoxal phosphate-dependent aminotransferase [Kordiimonas sp.]